MAVKKTNKHHSDSADQSAWEHRFLKSERMRVENGPLLALIGCLARPNSGQYNTSPKTLTTVTKSEGDNSCGIL